MSPRSRPSDAVPASLDLFYTSDAPMQACLDRARSAASTDLPLLILGESGSGKTMLARAIHNSSNRRAGPFVSFNAAALSESLIDSQLFGHERGAFTGAHQRVKGKFELADAGTLFVDEVADLTPTAQAKILRAVESGEFERLGSETLRQADVRVISATHHDLASGNGGSSFRDDLFFRISSIRIVVPPLRDRPRDLPTLLAHEVERAAAMLGKKIVGFDRRAADRLLAYPWPGNLRELSSVIHAAVALAVTDVIGEELLLLSDTLPTATARAGSGRRATAGPAPGRSLRDIVRRHVASVLAELGGNKRRAARELGISRATLDRHLRESPRRSR